MFKRKKKKSLTGIIETIRHIDKFAPTHRLFFKDSKGNILMSVDNDEIVTIEATAAFWKSLVAKLNAGNFY